jgi:sulfur relay (sulfurtransferase) complex TusBCD TusD component (DsrE family)
MKVLSRLLFSFALALAAVSLPALAADKAPLFINLTTDEPHRANMAISFGKNQLERGHALTIFLNDRGVLVGAKAQAGKFGNHQKALADLVGKGATVLICQMCMKHYGVGEGDLVPGIRAGNPELTEKALFHGNTKSLTW